jgi:protein pelota
VVPSSLDDLWHLEQIICSGDLVSGESERKIKPSREGEKTKKIPVFVKVRVEKTVFHKESGALRVLGVVEYGKPEGLVEIKTHHTIEAMVGKKIRVEKQELKEYEIERLNKARKASQREKILVVVLDDESADVFGISDFGIEPRARILSNKTGKRFAGENKDNEYFKEVVDSVKRTNCKKVLFAGPGFTKDELKKYFENQREKMDAVFVSLNSAGGAGVSELLKSGKIDSVVKDLEISREAMLVESVLRELGKNTGLVEYGFAEVKNAVEAGAADFLLVSDEFLAEQRENAELLMKSAEKKGARVHIISTNHDLGKQLIGLGGMVCKLRYKLRG